MTEYRARKPLQIGEKLYAPGDIIEDPPEIIGSWVYWGDAEVVEPAPEPPKKKAAAKKTAKKAADHVDR